MLFKKSLISLAIGGFGIGLTEFLMMGILPEVAKDFGITIPEAGHFVASYAIGVVIGAPILVLIAGNYAPKKILVTLMLAFTVFNSLAIFASNYEFMVLSRLLSGLPHGAFFGVGAVVASRLVDKSKEASAIAMMLGGLTIANIVGIPFAIWLGENFTWRYAFVMVAIVGVLAVTSISFWMPDLPKKPRSNAKNDLRVFLHAEPWFILGITAVGTGGFFAWFSYIKPLLINVTGFPEGSVIIGLLSMAGVGMTVGNFAGGKLADKVSPGKATAILLSIMVLCLISVSLVAPYKIPTIIMTFVTAMFAFSTASPIQMLMINASKGSEMLASSANQAGFNMGNALGAYLGGLPIAYGFGYASPEWVGAGMASCGVMITLLMLLRRKRKAKSL
ncbi:MFS transporter [Neptunitalea lumnitzerae]|uniref:MFS transporter AraJ n=1 Tax=Neptunitalea lumnitzerae TaxID=2965509 RepID=A0ABQ5MLK0_9FLAO|nr:MFS transporter [Neptunitalea sp. Y10]GLB50281.1 MFS transporter AraJ [Neptunitalea sp. Y10]